MSLLLKCSRAVLSVSDLNPTEFPLKKPQVPSHTSVHRSLCLPPPHLKEPELLLDLLG